MRVGLAGAGWVSQHHLAAWKSVAEVVAICDPVRGRAEERAREYGIEAAFDDPAEMLRTMELHALDIAAPREAHAPLVRLAMDFGVPAALCQKPLAPGLSEAESLVRDADGRIRLMAHDNWRFRPWYRQMHAWLASGAIGAVRKASITMFTSALAGSRPLLERQPFLARLDRLMVGEVLVHHLDTARFLFGELTLLGASLGTPPPHLAGEDWATLVLSTHDGGPILVAGNLAAHGYPATVEDEVTVWGDEGAITLRGGDLTLSGAAAAAIRFDLAAGYQQSYNAAIAHFVEGLSTGAAFETSPEDNLETLRLVEHAYAGR